MIALKSATKLRLTFYKEISKSLLALSLILVVFQIFSFANQFNSYRAQAYDYNTKHERFYSTAEWMQSSGISTSDLVIVHTDEDCWFRYYILFLTGAEAKTLLEISFKGERDLGEKISAKYNRMYFVMDKEDSLEFQSSRKIELKFHDLYEFDLSDSSVGGINSLLQIFVNSKNAELDEEVQRIKLDKTSCQWLVPDEILNSPVL